MFDDQRKVNTRQSLHEPQLGEFTIQHLCTNTLHWWFKVTHEVGKWSDVETSTLFCRLSVGNGQWTGKWTYLSGAVLIIVATRAHRSEHK